MLRFKSSDVPLGKKSLKGYLCELNERYPKTNMFHPTVDKSRIINPKL